jgi:hypothetical protein
VHGRPNITVDGHHFARQPAIGAVVAIDPKHRPVVQAVVDITRQHDIGRGRKERPRRRVVDLERGL